MRLCIFFQCIFFRLRIEPSHCVDVKGIDGQRGEKGFLQCGLFHSSFDQFIILFISNDVCVGSDFADGDIVVRCIQHVYYSGHEELIWVIITA